MRPLLAGGFALLCKFLLWSVALSEECLHFAVFRNNFSSLAHVPGSVRTTLDAINN